MFFFSLNNDNSLIFVLKERCLIKIVDEQDDSEGYKFYTDFHERNYCDWNWNWMTELIFF